MFRARERGMSYWPFVVSLVALLVVTFMWYEAMKVEEDLRSDASRAKTATSEWQTKYTAMNNRLLELVDSTGYAGTDSYPDKEAIGADVQKFLTSMREQLTLEFETDKFAPTGDGGKIEQIGQGKFRVTYMPAEAELARATTVESVFPIVLAAAKRMLVDVNHHVQQKATAESGLASAQSAHGNSLTQKDQTISDLQTQMQALQANLAEQGSDLRDQIAALEGNLNSARSELEEFRAQSDKTVADLSNKLSQSKGEVMRLNQREVPFVSEGPDGEVLAADAGMAILDRGKTDMLMPGTVFTVLGRAKGGALYAKGIVKVTSVDAETARCRVIEEASRADPIGSGDLVQSGTYSPNRKLHFHLLGEFSRMGKSQAESRLTSLGASIDNDVLTTTHYLVMGTPGPGVDNLEDTDAYRRAKEYGTPIITESQLSSFTRY